MAVSKERLEELIKKEATIWAVYDTDRIEKIKLVIRMFGVSVDEYNRLHDCEPMLYSQFCGIFKDICPISWLFETKSEAEEYAEFGNITRTDTLKMPTWKDVLDICKTLEEQKRHTKIICEFDDVELNIYKDNGIWFISIWNYDYDALLSRENYDNARRLCVKLFRGESV